MVEENFQKPPSLMLKNGSSERAVSITCTPRVQICKRCTPHAAGSISCARQNWRVNANHAEKFSVHAEDLPENCHIFQTGYAFKKEHSKNSLGLKF